MRCKKHFSDPSSAVGVCASCLRERLLVFIDAQSQPLPLPPTDDRLPPPPPPLVFPRSVSPYISRRKSDTADADADRKQLFFSTPQAAPIASKINKKKSKFGLFSSLFRSGSAKSRRSSDPDVTASESHASSSSTRKKSILRLSSLDETSSASNLGRRERGMSPDVDYDFGCSPRRTPRTSHARVPASPARSQLTSGIGFCLSPLMRPSPGRHWKGKSAGVEAGEIRPNLSTAASLRANRSRKLADFGRFDHSH